MEHEKNEEEEGQDSLHKRVQEKVLTRTACTGSNKLFLEQNYGKSYNVSLISKEAGKRFQ